MSISTQERKENVVHTCNEFDLAVTKTEMMKFAGAQVELEQNMLSAAIQTQNDKYCMISVIRDTAVKGDFAGGSDGRYTA